MKPAEATLLIRSLAQWCQAHGGRYCYQNWSPETLQDYLGFHLAHGQLAFVQASGPDAMDTGEIFLACAVAWRTFRNVLEHAQKNGCHPFTWEPADPLGDCCFIADVVATNKIAFMACLHYLGQVHPDWARLPIYTFRRKKLVRLDAMRYLKHSRILWNTTRTSTDYPLIP